MREITILEHYRLTKSGNAPKEGTFEVISGTNEEYEEYQQEKARDSRDFEARMEERRKIKDVLCVNCGHECGWHTLFQECRMRSSTGELFCNCPDFAAPTDSK